MKSKLKRTLALILSLAMSVAVCSTLFTVTNADEPENLALSATAYAYTKRGTSNDFIPAHGNDGTTTTEWRTANKGADKGKFVNGDGSVITWYALVFDEPVELNTLKLTFATGQDAVINYQLQIPADGAVIDATKLDTPSTEANAANADNPFYDNSLWQTIVTAPDNSNKGRADTFSLEEAVTTQYLRVFVPLESRGDVVAIQEIEVYNMSNTQALIDELNGLLDEAVNFIEYDVSAESWGALQSAIAQAGSVDTSDADALEAAIDKLSAAIDGVELANIALSATPYAYAWAQQAKYNPTEAIDGVIGADQGWRSRNKGVTAGQTDGEDITWFGLDFGTEVDLATLKLTFTENEDIVTTYQIQIPAEGKSIDLTDIDNTVEGCTYGMENPFSVDDNWETIYTASEKSTRGRTDVVILDNIKTQYIRIFIPEDARKGVVRLGEIEAYSDYRSVFFLEGAQKRVNQQDSSMYDMRYVTSFNKEFYNDHGDDIAEIGTLMVRRDQLTAAGKNDADINFELFEAQTPELIVENVAAVYFIEGLETIASDCYAFVNTIICIDEEKLDTEYVVISYIKFADGRVIYSNSCSRSISYLIEMEL